MSNRVWSVILLFVLAAPLVPAKPTEDVKEFQRNGNHTVQREIRDKDNLLYRYTLETDAKTKMQIREVHSFYMSGTVVFSIIENEKRRIYSHRSGPRGSVVHTVEKEKHTESVWVADYSVENGGWLFVRNGSTYFRYSPSPRELDEDSSK